jgi:hypothetical protein
MIKLVYTNFVATAFEAKAKCLPTSVSLQDRICGLLLVDQE